MLLWKNQKCYHFLNVFLCSIKLLSMLLGGTPNLLNVLIEKWRKQICLTNKALIVTKLHMLQHHGPSFIAPSNQLLLLNLSYRMLCIWASFWGAMMLCVLMVFLFLTKTTTLCFVAMMMMMICSFMMSLTYFVSYAKNTIIVVKSILLFDDEFLIGLILCPWCNFLLQFIAFFIVFNVSLL